MARLARLAYTGAKLPHPLAVTPAKQARLIAAAEAWLQSSPAEKQPRFDVIEVYGEEGAAAPRIRQIENAFGG